MARPAKAVAAQSGVYTKETKRIRQYTEDTLKGAGEAPEAPEYLSQEQKEIYAYIVSGLAESGILGKLDVFILESTAVAISQLRAINRMVDANPDLLLNASIHGTRAKYQSDLFRGCNELCLSPQARAKIGSLAAQTLKAKEDPLIKALSMDD